MQELYKYAKKMLPNEVVRFVSSWMLIKSKSLPTTDKQIQGSPWMHTSQDDVLTNVLHYCQSRVEKETNLQLSPTYGYTRLYRPGADLQPHLDRPACEISVSITMQYSYKNKNYRWPICMENKPIIIELGDGVIYKGCEVSHWRPIFTEDPTSWHHQIFLHYVDLNGPNSKLKKEV